MTRQSTPPSITAAAAPISPRALLRRGRLLKRWRYVGVFSEELMACAASVRVGFARQVFWAVHLRPDGGISERTRMLRTRGVVELESSGRVRVRDRGIELELELEEEAGWEARCDDGGGEVWTRKQAGIAARGTLRVGTLPPRPIDARAVVDDTVGYHPRHTEWHWSAGVGEDPRGTPIAWNLVSGINDPPSGSERAVWVDGLPHEAPPVRFSADLESIEAEDGSTLHFAAEAVRERRENLLLVRSDYRAPFGSFSGALPGAVPLARGLGVVEHHRAVW